MRYFVLAVIVLILASLASALVFMVRDKGQSKRTVKMLALRVGLSIALFIVLMASYKLGYIHQRL